MNQFATRALSGAAVLAGLTMAWPAFAGSTFHFNANQVYRGLSNSPFASADAALNVENFEDGLLNTVGMTIDRGRVQNSGIGTDSVDRDDGDVDGWGREGHSYTSGSSRSVNIRFTASNGNMPQMAGLVWTDVRRNASVVFKAWDRNGNYLGFIRTRLGDHTRRGTTGDDRFMGISSEDGISRIELRSSWAGFEMDHIQFAYSMVAVPVPPAVGMGAAGLAGLGLLQWRRRRRAIRAA